MIAALYVIVVHRGGDLRVSLLHQLNPTLKTWMLLKTVERFLNQGVKYDLQF